MEEDNVIKIGSGGSPRKKYDSFYKGDVSSFTLKLIHNSLRENKENHYRDRGLDITYQGFFPVLHQES